MDSHSSFLPLDLREGGRSLPISVVCEEPLPGCGGPGCAAADKPLWASVPLIRRLQHPLPRPCCAVSLPKEAEGGSRVGRQSNGAMLIVAWEVVLLMPTLRWECPLRNVAVLATTELPLKTPQPSSHPVPPSPSPEGSGTSNPLIRSSETLLLPETKKRLLLGQCRMKGRSETTES